MHCYRYKLQKMLSLVELETAYNKHQHISMLCVFCLCVSECKNTEQLTAGIERRGRGRIVQKVSATTISNTTG